MNRIPLLGASLRTASFWLLGLAALVLLSAAFQIPYTYTIDFGRRDDRFLIQGGMHDAENDKGLTFRWTRGRATIFLPALTSGTWTLDVDLNGWQPKGPTQLQFTVGDTVSNYPTNGKWETWHQQLTLPAGDTLLVFQTPTFTPSAFGNEDPRRLGVRFDQLTLAPSNAVLRVPPLVSYILPMSAAVMLCYLLVSTLSFRQEYALAISGLVLAGFLALVAFYRSFLNETFLAVILIALGVTLGFNLFALDALGTLYRRAGISISTRELNWLCLIVAGILIVKLAGVLYPKIFIFDGVFHLHRFQSVEEGNLYFVTRSREFRGLPTVYPPGPYIFLSPLGTLAPNDEFLLKLVIPLCEAISALVLFWIARKNGLSALAACCAVFLYLAAPIAFIIFGWGVYANIFAELVFIVTLAVWFALPWARRALASALLFSFCLFIGVLAHASMIALLLIFWGLVAIGDFIILRQGQRAVLTIVSLGAAFLIAFGLYFSYFLDQVLKNLASLQTNSLTSSAAGFERIVGSGIADSQLGLVPVRVHSVGEWLIQSAWYIAREAWVYYAAIIVVLALIGLVLLWREPALRPLSLVLSAGFLTVLFFFFIGMFFNLYTRYMLFGAPFFALGAGFMLDRLWQKRMLGRPIVVGTLALILLWGFTYWIHRVVF